MRVSVSIIFCMAFCTLHFSKTEAQGKVVQYFDSSWFPVSGGAAKYYCDFIPENKEYLCKCYLSANDAIIRIAHYDKPAIYARSSGISLAYYDSGELRDSTISDAGSQLAEEFNFYENGQLKNAVYFGHKSKIDSGFHYYPDGQQKAVYKKTGKKNFVLKVFDVSGKQIKTDKSYVYYQKAAYPGGPSSWKNYIQKKIADLVTNYTLPDENFYAVMAVQIMKDGKLGEVIPMTKVKNPILALEYIKIIQRSSPWKPEIILNEPLETTKYLTLSLHYQTRVETRAVKVRR